MRAATIFSVIFVLAACLLRSSEAVTCTAAPTDANCIDCTQAANAQDAECLAEAAATTTTVAPTTTAATTVAPTSATATSATATGGRRRVVRFTNLRFSVTRRVRINRNRSSTSRTTIRNRRNRQRRVNVRNRRGNGNVRVIVG